MRSSKAKSKGVSASSFLDLQAEMAKKTDEMAKAKAAGLKAPSARPDKKPTVWGKRNKGVASRNERDLAQDIIDKPTIDKAYSVLAKKVVIYDKLNRGKTAGLTDDQRGVLLVDFDSKGPSRWESDSEDEDESRNVPVAPDDIEVEYIDEHGRTRLCRRSEIPIEHAHQHLRHDVDEDEADVIRNPLNYYPIYQPSEERVAEVKKALQESETPLDIHYDASKDNRQMGVAHMNLHGNDHDARVQVLKDVHQETIETRRQAGAEDARLDGMVAPTTSVTSKRQRDLEERKAALAAKRQKKNHHSLTDALPPPPPMAAPPPPYPVVVSGSVSIGEPCAALEMQGADQGNDADAFLAQLEQDIFQGQ